jgi:putative transcriptional regulator
VLKDGDAFHEDGRNFLCAHLLFWFLAAIDMTTMRQFDASCLATPAALEPAQIKQIRESAHVSQPVFSRYLNTSESTVQKWETGSKQPSAMALKLLSVVQKHGWEVLA